METELPDSQSRSVDAAAPNRDLSWQLRFGVLPAALCVFFLTMTAPENAPALFPLSLAGLAGMIWSVYSMPRWTALPRLALLACGYIAIILGLWPASYEKIVLEAVSRQVAFILPLVLGPMAVGAYQGFEAIKSLRPFRS